MDKIDRSERLAVYLDAIGADAAFWARSNCLLFPGRWVALEQAGFDVSAWFGACDNALSAARLMRRHGGVNAFFGTCAAEAGLAPIAPGEAQIGDIALIAVPRMGRPRPVTLGCIRTATRWAIRTRDGMALVRADTMRVKPHLAWKV